MLHINMIKVLVECKIKAASFWNHVEKSRGAAISGENLYNLLP